MVFMQLLSIACLAGAPVAYGYVIWGGDLNPSLGLVFGVAPGLFFACGMLLHVVKTLREKEAEAREWAEILRLRQNSEARSREERQ